MNTTGKISRLNPEHADFQAILALDREQFPRPWSLQDWQELNWGHHLLFAWEIKKQPVGFALYSFVPGDDSAHLLKICISAELRGQGISQAFWESCKQYLKSAGLQSIYLEVESQNQRAIGFYQKLGFETLRTIKGYYSDGADARTMQMTI